MLSRNLGERIRKIRELKGLSQKELAKLVGKTPGMISRYETAIESPSTATFVKIANALDVDARALLCGNVNADKGFLINEMTSEWNRLTPEEYTCVASVVNSLLQDIQIQSAEDGC